MSNVVTVSTVAPASIPARMIPVIARTKAKKGETISDSQRLRAIVIPEFSLVDLPSKWQMFAHAQLAEIAKQQLAELWKQNGDSLREVAASLFSVDSLLAFAAREADSRRLTGDSIAANASEFISTLNPKLQALAKEILVSMAAPTKKGDEKQCFALGEKLEKWIEEKISDDSDSDPNPVLLLVQQKLISRANELKEIRLAFEMSEDPSF